VRPGMGSTLKTDPGEPPQASGEASRPRWAAVIMAAGQGTRMHSALPKVAHHLAGRPIVRHVVEAARAAGIDECIVVVGPDESADAVRASAGEVRFAVQQQALGTGDAAACAEEAAAGADYILIMNGDVPLVLPSTLKRLMAPLSEGANVALLTAEVPVEAYGFLELTGDRVAGIVETKEGSEIDRSELRHINAGQYAVRAEWLWSHLHRITPAPNGERYLTQLAAMAYDEGNPAAAVLAEDVAEVRGVNDRVQLADAEHALRERINRRHMLAGVTIVDPATTYIDVEVTIGADSTIAPGTHLEGATSIGERCEIGPASLLRAAQIGDGCVIRFSMVEDSVLESDVDVGPYSHVRPGSHICQGVHIGNYAEVKASRLGRRTKIGHFSYVGDSDIGEDVNIGAGAITANYDGVRKNRTVIGDGAFIGSDTMLVAPVRIGRGASTSAGAVVNRDVPDGMIAIGAPARLRAKHGGAPRAAEDANSEQR